jgi:hypothetical protein
MPWMRQNFFTLLNVNLTPLLVDLCNNISFRVVTLRPSDLMDRLKKWKRAHRQYMSPRFFLSKGAWRSEKGAWCHEKGAWRHIILFFGLDRFHCIWFRVGISVTFVYTDFPAGWGLSPRDKKMLKISEKKLEMCMLYYYRCYLNYTTM